VIGVAKSALCIEWRTSHKRRTVQWGVWHTADWRSGIRLSLATCYLLQAGAAQYAGN